MYSSHVHVYFSHWNEIVDDWMYYFNYLYFYFSYIIHRFGSNQDLIWTYLYCNIKQLGLDTSSINIRVFQHFLGEKLWYSVINYGVFCNLQTCSLLVNTCIDHSSQQIHSTLLTIWQYWTKYMLEIYFKNVWYRYFV